MATTCRQPDDVPGNQSKSLCPGREINHFENVESDKKGSSSAGASDEACEHEILKICEHEICEVQLSGV